MNAVTNRGYAPILLSYKTANQPLNFRGSDPDDIDDSDIFDETEDLDDQDTLEISTKKTDDDAADKAKIEAKTEEEAGNNNEKIAAKQIKDASEKDKAKKNEVYKDKDFSLDNAASNFGKGFISPITSMFSSATNFVIGAGAIGICAALMKATKNQIGILFVVGGTIYGGLQTAIGLKKVIGAKNNETREKAFYDVGTGTGILLTSTVLAKPTLQAAGCSEAETYSVTKATRACFEKAPDAVTKSVEVLNNSDEMAKIFSVASGKSSAAVAVETKYNGANKPIGSAVKKGGSGSVAGINGLSKEDNK